MSCIEYVKEVYKCKKYAFVIYYELYVMCTYNGLYLDTDIEIVKN